jgi:glycosyltransferase involved in cell wall biosynthesis
MSGPLLLDISRLLSRAKAGAPTGIDRVELAYAEHLLTLAPERLVFVALDRFDRVCALPRSATRRFIADLAVQWAGNGPAKSALGAAAHMIWARAMLRPGASRLLGAPGERPTYLLLSHRHLHRREGLQRAMAAIGARLVVFVHDLIPIEFPEYCRPAQAERHRTRIETVAALADAVIVNSRATASALQPFLEAAGRNVPVLAVPLGVPTPSLVPLQPTPGAHFVCISTIEPRKNHLMLLNIWRRLGETMGEATPHLYLIGRRGWENENVVDMLERSPAIRRHVTECRRMTDTSIAALLAGCRALLFPSFAEGFGLPIAEALALGAPVICSDLPALRETGGDVPEYLDPLDAAGWLEAVTDYLQPGSERRARQAERLLAWQAPCWPAHVAEVLAGLKGNAEKGSSPSKLLRSTHAEFA